MISLRELLTNTQLIISSTFRFAELYAAVALWYLVLVSIFMIIQARIERRYVWSSRGPEGAMTRAVQRGDAMSRQLDGDDGRRGQQPPMSTEPIHGGSTPRDPAAGHDLPVGHLLDASVLHEPVHADTASSPITSSRRATSTSATARRRSCGAFTFGVHRGDVKAVLGPSGSGQSTLLRCLALLEPIDAGEIRLEGPHRHQGWPRRHAGGPP